MRKMITSTNEKELQDLIEYGGVIIDNTPITINISISGDGTTSNDKVVISKNDPVLIFDFSYFYGKNLEIYITGSNTLGIIFIMPTYSNFLISNASNKNISISVSKFTSPMFLVQDNINNVIAIGQTFPINTESIGFTDGRFSFFSMNSV